LAQTKGKPDCVADVGGAEAISGVAPTGFHPEQLSGRFDPARGRLINLSVASRDFQGRLL
jgi:hypothetical protein